jgi:hypothetical protein
MNYKSLENVSQHLFTGYIARLIFLTYFIMADKHTSAADKRIAATYHRCLPVRVVIQIARLIFLVSCGLLNFIYLVVSPINVFTFITGGDTWLLKRGAASPPQVMPSFLTGHDIIPSFGDSVFFLPLYLFLALLALTGFIFFIGLLIEIPSLIARFYINRLGDYIFIDGRRTVKFFVMLLLPAAYYATVVFFNPESLGYEVMEGMIMNTISHSGVVLLIICIAAFKDFPAHARGETFRVVKMLYGICQLILLVAVTFVMFAGPYLAFYHIETDRLWVGVFHLFLIYSIYTNYTFYRNNGIIRTFVEDD